MRIEVNDIRVLARGRWREIVRALGDSELQRVADAPLKTHVTCPFHAGANDFRLDDTGSRFGSFDENGGAICTCGSWSDGFALLMQGNGWSFREALQEVACYLGVRQEKVTSEAMQNRIRRSRAAYERQRIRRVRERHRRNRSAVEKIRAVWDAGLSLRHPLAEPARRYLARRGLSLEVATSAGLRYHSNLPYFEKNGDGRLVEVSRDPALLAMVVSGSGDPVTVHRTYLTPQGGKRSGKAKKLMAYPDSQALVGGAIRLFPVSSVLGVSEGVETALSVHFATGMPVWPTTSATLLAQFDPPPGVRHVVIWADKDRSGTGQASARELKMQLCKRGIKVTIMFPTYAIPARAKGIDWNDVWQSLGAAGFPVKSRWDAAA